MTLLDAPAFNAHRARTLRNLGIAAGILVLLAIVGATLYAMDIPWALWNWPADHRVNTFLDTVQSGNMAKAYGVWNHDADWQQHADQYKNYDFTQFQKDWGPASDYGVIKNHQIVVAKRVGNGVVMGVDINGGKTPIFLRVDDKTKEIGFSPVELYVGP